MDDILYLANVLPGPGQYNPRQINSPKFRENINNNPK